MGTDLVKILIADDEPTMLSLMRAILAGEEGCTLYVAQNGEEALAKVRVLHPDIVITDLKMPRMCGEDLTTRALLLQPDLTVLVATGNGTLPGAVNLMREGAYDYITKPFLVEEFLKRVQRAVRKVRTEPLSRTAQAMIASLLAALEAKDPYLRNHSSRVAQMSLDLSLALGLGRRQALMIERAAIVHDLGKIGIAEAILNKPGSLTNEEMAEIKKHPVRSVEIIEPLKEFKECVPDVLHHHERIDGSGYPEGLKGDEIPVGARIIAVCDAFDAMASARPYRSGLPLTEIRRRLLEARGTQLEQDFVDTFLRRQGDDHDE